MEYIPKILFNLFNNISQGYHSKKGMIIASPSLEPDYNFHWIRDSALVMRVIIELYKDTKDHKYFNYLINYIENEYGIQNIKTLSGLGEPKYNTNGTSFDDSWGRPQNDGPALRGIMMLKIFNLFDIDYPNINRKLISIIIYNDLKYTLKNLNNPCFDLWEENYGYHFYTRIVQLKFIKEYLSSKKKLDNYFTEDDILDTCQSENSSVDEIYINFMNNIEDHLDSNTIIASFDLSGNISRKVDASILHAFCHIDFDLDIIGKFNINRVIPICYELLTYFRKKYHNNELLLIGRYPDDKYQDGHTWIICSLALAQIYTYLYQNDTKFKAWKSSADKILSVILALDKNLDLAEQYDPINKLQISAQTLTWNYSELYMTIKNLN